jgi:uncharacterized protein (TIGR02466 family)
MIYEFFPKVLSVETLGIEKDTSEKIMLMASETKNHIQNSGSNFFHNETYIFETVFKNTKLVKDVYEHINKYLTDVLGEKPNSLRITQSWMNINPPGTIHDRHLHSNSIVSGVIYIKVDDKSGRFMIHRKEEDKVLRNTITNYNKFNFEHMWFEPKPSELYLFQSNMVHSVGMNESTIDRISLSFNTFYTGIIGDRLNTTELCL